jgi:hypothetical protein
MENVESGISGSAHGVQQKDKDMKDIGRNDPCPCGSGKKHKKCCLGKPPFVVDFGSKRISEIAIQNARETSVAAFAMRDRMAAARKSIITPPFDAPDQAASALKNYLGWLEGELGKLLATHSSLFWLLLDRRLPFGLDNPSTNVHVINYLTRKHEVKTTAFLKYSSNDLKDVTWNIDGTVVPDVKTQDVVTVWGDVSEILNEVLALDSAYRRVGKGATIDLQEPYIEARLDQAMDECCEIYDRRRAAYSVSLSPIGTLASFQGEAAEISSEFRADRRSTMVFLQNFEGREEYQLTSPKTGRIRHPNFLPRTLSLEALELLAPFESRLIEVTGLTVRQLRLCFVALKQFVLDHWEGEYTFVQRGLFISESGLLEPALATLLTALFQLEGEPANSNLVSNAFVKLLSTGSKLGRQLLSHGAFGCLHRFRDQDFFDLTLHPLVLNSILMEIQLDGEMRVIKGSHFEEEVSSRLLADVPKASYPMQPGLNLKRKGEHDPYAECDVYLAVGNLLFVVDCKAYSYTLAYFGGERKAVESRSSVVQGWLAQSDNRARKIAITPIGANYEIPTGITHLIPLVCTAFPEFIWDLAPEHFLVDRSIPRVCTYGEMIEVLNGDPAGLINSPFAIPIKR